MLQMVRRLNVLLVNDDPLVCGPMAEALGRRHHVRVATGLRHAVDELVRSVPDAIVCSLDLTPFRGDALLAMVAREHPNVRRVLYAGAGPGGAPMDGAAHVTLTRQATLAELLAAIAGDE